MIPETDKIGIHPPHSAPENGAANTPANPAPRVTSQMIDDEIASEHFHTFPGTTVIVCMLVLRNGSTVIGKSHCGHFSGHDTEIGRDIAKGKARQAIYPLLKFMQREHSHLKECKRDDQVRRLRAGERGGGDPLITAVISAAGVIL